MNEELLNTRKFKDLFHALTTGSSETNNIAVIVAFAQRVGVTLLWFSLRCYPNRDSILGTVGSVHVTKRQADGQ